MIDIGRAAQHPFEDQNWISKFLIGGLINIVPILNLAGFGYAIDHLKSVSRGQNIPLPTWDDLGAKFVTGLKLAVVNFILALPMFVIVCVATVLPALGAGASDAGDDAFAVAFLGTSTVLLCVVGVYGLALALLAPAIYIQLARTDTIAACLRLGELWAIARRTLGDCGSDRGRHRHRRHRWRYQHHSLHRSDCDARAGIADPALSASSERAPVRAICPPELTRHGERPRF